MRIMAQLLAGEFPDVKDVVMVRECSMWTDCLHLLSCIDSQGSLYMPAWWLSSFSQNLVTQFVKGLPYPLPCTPLCPPWSAGGCSSHHCGTPDSLWK